MSTSGIEDKWIADELENHLRIDFDIDYTFLVSFIGNNFNVEDVFPIGVLEDWAEENGYIREL